LNSTSGSITPQSILQLLNLQFGIRMLLHEGGPILFGQFLAAEAVDELFLTLSPQIAGRRGDAIRPAVLQGVESMLDSAPWFQLLSVKQKAEHLYLRYRRTRTGTSK
jgi:riboflavin biosynthesis pyrimidine reductase